MEYFFNFPYYVRKHPELFELELKFLDPLITASQTAAQITSLEERKSYSVQLPSVFILIVAIQYQIWLTSKFGEYQILSEVHDKNKLKVRLKAGESYVTYLLREEIETMSPLFQQIHEHICKI
jgi:hypothetical protein